MEYDKPDIGMEEILSLHSISDRDRVESFFQKGQKSCCIVDSDELGYRVFAIDIGDDFWLLAFETESEAHKFCELNEIEIEVEE